MNQRLCNDWIWIMRIWIMRNVGMWDNLFWKEETVRLWTRDSVVRIWTMRNVVLTKSDKSVYKLFIMMETFVDIDRYGRVDRYWYRLLFEWHSGMWRNILWRARGFQKGWMVNETVREYESSRGNYYGGGISVLELKR